MTRTEIKCYKLCDKIKDKLRMQPASQPVFVEAKRIWKEQNGQENEIDILKGVKTNKILPAIRRNESMFIYFVQCCSWAEEWKPFYTYTKEFSRDTLQNISKKSHTQKMVKNSKIPVCIARCMEHCHGSWVN